MSAIIGLATLLYASALQSLMPADWYARLAQEERVALEHSLSKGEAAVDSDFYDPTVVAPAQAAPATAAALGVTLVITALAKVFDETGARVELSAKEGPCPARAQNGDASLKTLKTQASAPALSLSLSSVVCVRVTPSATLYLSQTVRGTWKNSGKSGLPELESAVARLAFTSPDGVALVVYLVAVGYCATEDGGCSATLALEKGHPQDVPTLPLSLEGEQVSLVFAEPD